MTDSLESNFWDATSFLMREMYASRFCPCGEVFDAAGAADADWAGSVFCATATESRHRDSAKAAMPFLIIFLPSLEDRWKTGGRIRHELLFWQLALVTGIPNPNNFIV